MNFVLTIQEEARKEMHEAQAWYLQKSSVAASNFENEITSAFARLASGLVDYREAIPGVRMLTLIAFPYNVYYRRREKEKTVQVIAILHTKRDAAPILKRLAPNKQNPS